MDSVIKRTSLKASSSKNKIEEALQEDSFRSIGIINWDEYPEVVQSKWKLLYGDDAFFLTFETIEPWVQAKYTGDTNPVCEDSCVEFFVSFDDQLYYNFEFNPIGACTIEKGARRENRQLIRLSQCEDLQIWTNDSEKPFDVIKGGSPWQVWVVIPFSVFDLQKDSVVDYTIKANFYKCGDGLPNKHYMSWSEVNSKVPDFHRPDYFKELVLEH